MKNWDIWGVTTEALAKRVGEAPEPLETAIERLSAGERIRLEFATALKQIAEAAKADPMIALDLYRMIETSLEQRVMQLVRQAAYQAARDEFDRGYDAALRDLKVGPYKEE